MSVVRANRKDHNQRIKLGCSHQEREFFYVGEFYEYASIKSDDELIDCPTGELQNIFVNYARHLVKRVNVANSLCRDCPSRSKS